MVVSHWLCSSPPQEHHTHTHNHNHPPAQCPLHLELCTGGCRGGELCALLLQLLPEPCHLILQRLDFGLCVRAQKRDRERERESVCVCVHVYACVCVPVYVPYILAQVHSVCVMECSEQADLCVHASCTAQYCRGDTWCS